MRQLLFFSLAGWCGFVSDLTGFYLFNHWFSIYPSRVLAFFIAFFVTYEINSRYTFGKRASRSLYFVGQSKAFVLNFCIFALVNRWLMGVKGAEYIAFVVGGWAAMAYNYFFSKLVVFKDR